MMKTHTIAARLRIAIAGGLCCGLVQISAGPLFALDASDDFDDNTVATNQWGADILTGYATLSETNEHLELRVGKGSQVDEARRPWILTQFPTTNDWAVQVTAFDHFVLQKKKQVATVGLYVRNWTDPYDNLFVEMYNSTFFGLPASRGFFSSVMTDGFFEGADDSFDSVGELIISNGAVRITFDSATKVLTTLFDRDINDGLQWVMLSSVGIAETGGLSDNTDWEMSNADRFAVEVYGYAEKTTITNGQVFADDFMSSGGIAYVVPPTRLTGNWTSAVEKCKPDGTGLVCTIKARLAVFNNTFSPINDTRIRVYLSPSNASFEEETDILLGTFQTGFVRSGKGRRLNLKVERAASSPGSFLLAIADNGAVLAATQLAAP